MTGWIWTAVGYAPTDEDGNFIRRGVFPPGTYDAEGGDCFLWCEQDPAAFALVTACDSNVCACYTTNLADPLYANVLDPDQDLFDGPTVIDNWMTQEEAGCIGYVRLGSQFFQKTIVFFFVCFVEKCIEFEGVKGTVKI